MNRFKTFFFDNIIPFLGRVFISRNKYINVIYYHDVVESDGYGMMRINLDKFKSQMTYIKENGYETLRFDDLYNTKFFQFKKKRVLIAFDDGWQSNYNMIFDWMNMLGIKYNIFLTVGEIGKNSEYLNWEQIKQMHSSGLCGFGMHTFTHPDMSDIQKVDTRKEIAMADECFKENMGFYSEDFCYPFGFYTESSNHWLSSKTSYKRIYTSAPFFSFKQNGAYIMSRSGISEDDTMKSFKDKLNGYQNIYSSVVAAYYKIVRK